MCVGGSRFVQYCANFTIKVARAWNGAIRRNDGFIENKSLLCRFSTLFQPAEGPPFHSIPAGPHLKGSDVVRWLGWKSPFVVIPSLFCSVNTIRDIFMNVEQDSPGHFLRRWRSCVGLAVQFSHRKRQSLGFGG